MTPSLSILMVVPLYPPPVLGGLERQAHELSKALVARGHKVIALGYAHDRSNKAIEVLDGVEVHRVGDFRFKAWNFALAPLSLINFMLRMRDSVDVVHVHAPSWYGSFTLKLAHALNKPTLFKLANVAELGIPGLQGSLSGRVRLSIIRRSSGIVAMCQQSLDELDSIGYPKKQVLFRPNGIPNGLKSGGPLENDQRTVRVTFVGRLNSQKRLPDLLRAWAILPSSGKPAMLQIVGEGPERANLETLVKELGIANRVQFLGHVTSVDAILDASDVFVLPSQIEGNSNAVLEAMRAGLPIVASRLSGTNLQVGSEGAALLFETGDIDSLAGLLHQLIENAELRRATGAAMRRRVETVFCMERVAADYEAAYRALLLKTGEGLSAIQWLASCRSADRDH